MAICEHCHQEFDSKYSWQKYCSPKHKHLAGAKARAARNLTLTERRCYRCKQVKPTEEFGSGGTHTYCKDCFNAWQRERQAALPLEERRAAARKFRDRQRADPKAVAAINVSRRRYLYGLTEEQFRALLDEQGGKCTICQATEPGGRGNWHVDHDHTCCPRASKGGKVKTCGRCVRGLLCSRCNVGLGNYRHDPELLIAAARYLVGYQTVNEIART